MSRVGTFLTLCKPTLFAGLFSLFVALAVGSGLALELDPDPRHAWTIHHDKNFAQFIGFSPDSETMIFERQHFQEPDDAKAGIYLLDLSSGRYLHLGDGRAPSVAFSPDGKQMAGMVDRTIILWDRQTGAELKRWTPDWLNDPNVWKYSYRVFYHDGELLLLKHKQIGNNKQFGNQFIVPKDALDVESGKVRAIGKAVLDQVADNARRHLRWELISSDGTWSGARRGEDFFVDNQVTGAKKKVPISTKIQDPWLYGVSPDGDVLLVWGTRKPPIRMGLGWMANVYFGADEPAGQFGLYCFDVETGDEIAFVGQPSTTGENRITQSYGFTPDEKTLVMSSGLDKDGSERIAFYDWPPRKPWWKIPAAVVVVYLGVYLTLKSLQWLRNRLKRRPAEEESVEVSDEDEARDREAS